MVEGEPIPADWMTRLVYFTGAEHVPHWPADNDPEVWRALKEQMEPGDLIQWFSTPGDFWVHLAGRMGYALVRDDKVVSWVVTMMN